MGGWRVDVSGATAIEGPAGPVDLRAKERSIVAALALHHPTPATAASLAPLIWGDDLPATAVKSIHNHVSRIRASAPTLIDTAGDGYRFVHGTDVTSSGSTLSYRDLADQPQVAVARARDRIAAADQAEAALRPRVRIMMGDPAFRSTFAELERVAGSLNERSRTWEMHFIRSNVAIIDGDLGAARQLIDESLSFVDMVNEDRVAAVFGAHHLVAALIDGTVDSFLDTVRELATEQPGVGAWRAALAAAAASAGLTDEALDALGQVIGDGTPNLRPDPTFTAGLITLGEAAALIGPTAPISEVEALLEPLAGRWSWCGSCTFGPIDLTRARLALAGGDRARAASIATDALDTTAAMRAPRFSRLATEVLVAALDAEAPS